MSSESPGEPGTTLEKSTLAGRLFARMVLFPDPRDYLAGAVAGERVRLRAPGGHELSALRARSLAGGGPVVVFFPGNSGNLSSHYLYIELLRRAGCEVLALDYAGFGESAGRACVASLAADAHAACDAARSWSRELGAGETVGLFGLSVGSNLALLVASEREDISGVAVEGVQIQREMIRGITIDGLSGPRTIEDIRDASGQPVPREKFRFPGLRMPDPLATWMGRMSEWSYPFAGKDAARVAARIASTPVFIAHGTDDRLLSFEAAFAVEDAVTAASQLWLMPGIGHAQEAALRIDDEYVAQLAEFFGTGEEPGPRDPAWSDSLEVRTEEGEGRARLRAGAPGGAHLLMVAGDGRLDFHHPWLEAGDEFRFELPPGSVRVRSRRQLAVEREGGVWRPRRGERADLYDRRYGSILRRLSSTLHDRRVEEAARSLEELAALEPPYPFDFIARLHCARLEDLAARRRPALAEQAREWFEQFTPRLPG